MTDAARKPALSLEELRGGFWPDMTGGLCSLCHIAITRGDTDGPDPEHPDCVAAASEAPTRNGPEEAQNGPSGARTAPGGPVPASSLGATTTAAGTRWCSECQSEPCECIVVPPAPERFTDPPTRRRTPPA